MTEQPNILKGSLYAIAAFFCMAVFGILTKMAYKEGSALWISCITYWAGTIALTPLILYQGIDTLQSDHKPYLIGRALFGTAASFLYMISMQYIPIVNATLLFNTAPIFIPIIAMVWLHCKVTKNTWLAIAIGFLGIIIIIKPTLAILTQSGNLIALLSGFFLAVAYLLIKLLVSTDSGVKIIFYYLGIGALIQLPLLYFAGPIPSLESCLYAITSGLLLLVSQLALVQGYKYAEAPQIGVYQYTSVMFIGLINWLLWDIVPYAWDLLGVTLVIIAGMMVIRTASFDRSAA